MDSVSANQIQKTRNKQISPKQASAPQCDMTRQLHCTPEFIFRKGKVFSRIASAKLAGPCSRVLRIFGCQRHFSIQLFPNWTANSSITNTINSLQDSIKSKFHQIKLLSNLILIPFGDCITTWTGLSSAPEAARRWVARPLNTSIRPEFENCWQRQKIATLLATRF